MKVKKILGYIGVGLIGVAAGAMIFSPETREVVFGKVKGAGSWVAGKISKKNDDNTCGDEVDPEVEEKPETTETESSEKKGNWGGYYKKPRYNNKKNNND